MYFHPHEQYSKEIQQKIDEFNKRKSSYIPYTRALGPDEALLDGHFGLEDLEEIVSFLKELQSLTGE